MKLNYEGRQEKRKAIKEFIETNPLSNGDLYYIDKEELEELLFETDLCHDYKEQKILQKYIVWSGDFLQFIDLSKVSFDNVDWDVRVSNHYRSHANHYKKINSINLSNTNAKIDFSKSFNINLNRPVSLFKCNFANVDLSNSHGEYILDIIDSNLSNTSINLDLELENKFFNGILTDSSYYSIIDSNLENVDLSKYTINPKSFTSEFDCLYISKTTNLSNTGININVFKKDYSKDILEVLKEMIQKDALKGCFINRQKISSKEEKQKRKETLKNEYNYFKEENINTCLNYLKNQSKVKKFR